MKFKIGDPVIHKSDKKNRKMVIAAICMGEEGNYFAERVKLKHIIDGSYYCTWISGSKKGDGIFIESELDHQ